MRKFESQSGAILNRTKKSKIMYLGSWAGKKDSPFTWLKVVEEVKVFRIILTPKYSVTFRRTWEEVVQGPRKTVYSWRDQELDSMFQKADVVRTFAQSELWYICQVLPCQTPLLRRLSR